MKLWNSRRNYQYEFDRTAALQLWSKTRACRTPISRALFIGSFLIGLAPIPTVHTED